MFHIDPMSRTPIYEQLTDQTETLILLGALQAGHQLPSVRALSSTLSINPNTVQKAYNDLIRMGILASVPGKGCFVAENAKEAVRLRRRNRLHAFEELVRELKLAGLTADELIGVVNELYNERRTSHVTGSTTNEAL